VSGLFANPVSIYLTVASTVLFIGGALLLVSRIRLAAGEQVRGQVIGYAERIRQRRASKRQYMPIVRFQPRGGRPVNFQSRMGSTSKPFDIGQDVPVIYRSDKPAVAEIRSAARLWLAPAVLLGMSAVSFYGAWKAGLPH
jgi:hypothetical protein